MKKVKRLLPAYQVDMGGAPLYQPFPTQNIQDLDPFLLLHHHETTLEPGTHPRDAGVDPHPHRGFSPVTFVIRGGLTHRDSRNNINTVADEGIQWLEAGMGIIHSERPSKEFAYDGGTLELVQLWINLPSNLKMQQPAYFALSGKESNKIKLSENSYINLYSGVINGQKGRLNPSYPVTSAFGSLKMSDNISLRLAENEVTFIYVISGEIKLTGFGLVEEKNLILFREEGEIIEFMTTKDTRCLILSAKPIREKIHKYGPYVMENETRVMEAMRDYQMGKMGFLVEEF